MDEESEDQSRPGLAMHQGRVRRKGNMFCEESVTCAIAESPAEGEKDATMEQDIPVDTADLMRCRGKVSLGCGSRRRREVTPETRSSGVSYAENVGIGFYLGLMTAEGD